MANATKYGFRPAVKYSGAEPVAHVYEVAASQTIVPGDIVTLDSAGRVIVAVANSSTFLLGVAMSGSAQAAVGTQIWVYDNPKQVFEAMVTTGALADVYTTRSLAACFDLTGTTGAMYVNGAASSQDLFKCVGTANDPSTGEVSAVGSNQMKYWMITSAMHVYGTIA